MARVISVTLPLWPIDRLRRSAPEGAGSSEERPLVLAGRVGSRRLVTAACAVAQDLGLSVGMQVSKAQALVPDQQVMSHDRAADTALLVGPAVWILQRVSLVVAVDPSDGLVMSGITPRAAIALSSSLTLNPCLTCWDNLLHVDSTINERAGPSRTV